MHTSYHYTYIICIFMHIYFTSHHKHPYIYHNLYLYVYLYHTCIYHIYIISISHLHTSYLASRVNEPIFENAVYEGARHRRFELLPQHVLHLYYHRPAAHDTLHIYTIQCVYVCVWECVFVCVCVCARQVPLSCCSSHPVNTHI